MLSIIICTHNPNIQLLNLVIKSIEIQSNFEKIEEIILIDNKSNIPLTDSKEILKLDKLRILNEYNVGKSNALISGIMDSKSPLILIVDDDSVLNFDYVEAGLKIAEKFENLGCFGGNQIGVFNVPLQSYLTPHLEMIGTRFIEKDRMSNKYSWETTPGGSGMFIRRKIAVEYVKQVKNDNARKSLGKRGKVQMLSEDVDMAYTSIDLGYLNGLFENLKIYHHIPNQNLTKRYLIKRKYFNVYSNIILEFIRFKKSPYKSSLSEFINTLFQLFKSKNWFESIMLISERIAINKGLKYIKSKPN